MIVDDLWTAKGPAPADLKVLERLAERRLAFESFEGPDEEEAIVIARALVTLDNMEECLCEEGRRAPLIAHGWMTLEQLETRLTDLRATPVTATSERQDTASATLGSGPPRVVELRRDLRSQTPSIEGSASPHSPGDPNLLITSIETLRSVSHRAAEDPSPNIGMPPVDEAIAFLPRAGELVKCLLGGKLDCNAVQIEAKALSIYVAVFDLCNRMTINPGKVMSEPKLTERRGAHRPPASGAHRSRPASERRHHPRPSPSPTGETTR